LSINQSIYLSVCLFSNSRTGSTPGHILTLSGSKMPNGAWMCLVGDR